MNIYSEIHQLLSWYQSRDPSLSLSSFSSFFYPSFSQSPYYCCSNPWLEPTAQPPNSLQPFSIIHFHQLFHQKKKTLCPSLLIQVITFIQLPTSLSRAAQTSFIATTSGTANPIASQVQFLRHRLQFRLCRHRSLCLRAASLPGETKCPILHSPT